MPPQPVRTKRRKPAKSKTVKPATIITESPILESTALPETSSPNAMLSAKTAAAAEQPKDRDYAKLSSAFRAKLQSVLAKLAEEGMPFKFDEGFRTIARQQWLFGSGRPNEPYGRSGPIVTHKDGVKNLSNHQGNGKAGSGNAADCYPLAANGKIIWPPPPMNDPRWKRFADVAKEHGLEAGYYWKMKDLPHIELK